MEPHNEFPNTIPTGESHAPEGTVQSSGAVTPFLRLPHVP